MVDDIGALLIEVFFGHWQIWLVIGLVMFAFIFILMKITEFFGGLWTKYQKRRKSRWNYIRQQQIFENGVIVEVLYRIPKDLYEQEAQKINLDEIIAEIKK